MTIGENIRYYRKQAHLTQKQLADLCGINELSVRGYETGKYKPKAEKLSKLSVALGCSINDLLNMPTTSAEERPLESVRYKRILDKISNGENIDQSDRDFLCSDCIREYYQALNTKGQKQVDKMISDLLEVLKLFPEIPQFQKENSVGKSFGKDSENGSK